MRSFDFYRSVSGFVLKVLNVLIVFVKNCLRFTVFYSFQTYESVFEFAEL